MTFYTVFFDDDTSETISFTFMATEAFRKANGGKSNAEIILGFVRHKFKGKPFIKIVRKSTGEVIYDAFPQ